MTVLLWSPKVCFNLCLERFALLFFAAEAGQAWNGSLPFLTEALWIAEDRAFEVEEYLVFLADCTSLARITSGGACSLST